MILKPKAPGDIPAPLHFLLTVFFPCGQSAPDVALLFVFIHDPTDLGIELRVDFLQPLLKVLVNGGFGNPEFPGCGTDGSVVFNHVHSQLAGPLLDRFIHEIPPKLCPDRITV